MDLSVIDTATLLVWQADSLAAMQALSTSRREVSLSLAHPQGSRAVTYNTASLPELRAWIASLASELLRRGIGAPRRRRAIGMRF
jgi:hypothetical protein